MDLFPTLAAVIQSPLPADRVYDGESLLPLFEDQQLNRKSSAPLFYYNCENLQAIKKGPWKLHLPRTKKQLPFWDKNKMFVGIDSPVLYNLEEDQAESTDIAANHPEVVQQLVTLAEETRQELGEFMQRGASQRPTGSLFPKVAVVSHSKDWGALDSDTRTMIGAERRQRYPDLKARRSQKSKKQNASAK